VVEGQTWLDVALTETRDQSPVEVEAMLIDLAVAVEVDPG